MVLGPPLGLSRGLICGLNTTKKRSNKAFDKVLCASSWKSLFLKDILNEITTFGGSLDAQYLPKISHNVYFETQIFKL